MDSDEEPDGLPEPKLSKPRPTNTMPGTPERVEVYFWRVERGEDIWHEDDATLQDFLCLDQE